MNNRALDAAQVRRVADDLLNGMDRVERDHQCGGAWSDTLSWVQRNRPQILAITQAHDGSRAVDMWTNWMQHTPDLHRMWPKVVGDPGVTLNHIKRGLARQARVHWMTTMFMVVLVMASMSSLAMTCTSWNPLPLTVAGVALPVVTALAVVLGTHDYADAWAQRVVLGYPTTSQVLRPTNMVRFPVTTGLSMMSVALVGGCALPVVQKAALTIGNATGLMAMITQQWGSDGTQILMVTITVVIVMLVMFLVTWLTSCVMRMWKCKDR